eukprot:gnl/TRDRNA2_/TRDRNA2_38827_c0_seq1.p1 gnl/TRDRNA2_/TRDRNA2_38827_c0~~gnl/TRDRNA2_/TRDRNA2_38827_c0_seq1.p1  ORF type:complete len:312 (+),score=37.79 gnl/TRDRNA2_/TRDRNA2_38827_c0_seq1:133-936(+)
MAEALVQLPQWSRMNVAIASSQVLGLGGFAGELSGQSAGYSKFANPAKSFKVASRPGMVCLYFPALMISVYYFLTAPRKSKGNGRETITAGLLTFHFGKRVLESLFLHKYSGTMDGDFLVPISCAYALTATLLAHQQLQVTEYSHPLTQPVFGIGVGFAAVGQLGNFYHHFLLAQLRKGDDGGDGGDKKTYVIPSGGLFKFVTMPHYFFELVFWLGFACVTQHLNSFLTVADMTSYLMGRSVATTRWYRAKFEDYPPERKHLFPFVF